ncbi:MAG: cytochrome b [Pseudomonadota bacterium]
MLGSSSTRFGPLAVLFHWTVFLGVFALFALGLYMTELDYYHPWYNSAPAVHKAAGILLLGLVLLRGAWRLFDRPPAPLDTHSTLERWTARAVHGALYALLVLVPLSGILIATADGRPIDVFGWFDVPALVSGLPRQEDMAGELHESLSWMLVGLASLHALAALKHHIFDHDDTLRRMTLRPLRSPPPAQGDKP